MVCPVMKSDAGEARYTASGPTSSGSPRRRSGILEMIAELSVLPLEAEVLDPGRVRHHAIPSPPSR